MTIDEDGPRLLGVLAVEPHTPPRVDIGQAMNVGHRRRRRRMYGVAGSVVAIVAVIAAVPVAITVAAHPATQRVAVPSVPSTYKPPAPIPAFPTSPTAKPRSAGLAAPTNCSAKILPIEAGARTGIVTGADPSGRYLVGYDYKKVPGGVDQNALLWTDGKGPTVIHASATDERVGVNSNGVVVGSGIDTVHDQTIQTAWKYEHGKLTVLHSTIGSYIIESINDSGQILAMPVPTVVPNEGYPFLPMSPVILDGDTVRHLATAPGSGARFTGAIDADGTVVGQADQSGQAFVWTTDGKLRELKGDKDENLISGIRDGWVIGASSDGDPGGPGEFAVARWDLRTGAVTAFPTLRNPFGAKINSQGWFVGTSKDRSAVFWGDHVTVLPQPAGGTSGAGSVAATISDDGHIIGGYAIRANEAVVPVRWTCH
jgi:uncharacterized membrane protein